MSIAAQDVNVTKEKRGELERLHTRHPNAFVRLFHALVSVFFLLCASLMTAIIIEWIGMAFIWPDEGVMHSARMLDNELNYLNAGFKHWVAGFTPINIASGIAVKLRYLLFDFTHLSNLYAWAVAAPADASYFRVTLMNITHFITAYFVSAQNTTELFAVRLSVIVLSMPIFILIGIASLTDGLVERELRKYGAGIERSYLFHRIKPWMRPVVIGSWGLYLALPFSLHPNFIFVPAALLFGFVVYMTAAYFMKFI